MADGINYIAAWHFLQSGSITPDVKKMLLDGERVMAVYKTVRDLAIFTDKRLIVRDAQGITGKKVETYSLPWSTVKMWSSENAGRFDIDSELELWTLIGKFKVNLNKKVDIREIDALLAHAVLGA